jgi:Family of unknown function (DUF5681)
MTDTHKEQEYKIGYKKPPRHTQFPPGRSGNPKGRPKKVPTLQELLSDVLNKKHRLTVNGESKKYSNIQIMFMKLAHEASKGNMKAVGLILKYLTANEVRGGDNLEALVREFRDIHGKHVSNDVTKSASTSGSDNEKKNIKDDDHD